MSKTIAKTFRASLERLPSELKWVIVRIPFDVSVVWKTRSRLKVKGDINGFAFRTSLFPTRDGSHFLLVNKQMQKSARARVGDTVKVRLEPDLEERVATIPTELKRMIAGDRALQRWFEGLNYSTKKYIADWIVGVKSPEARVRRAEQIAERALLTIEAERELPPILKVAFAREPKAQDGWEQMSAAQRRGHLFGIFSYRNPESRARRLQKMIDDALARVEKRSAT